MPYEEHPEFRIGKTAKEQPVSILKFQFDSENVPNKCSALNTLALKYVYISFLDNYNNQLQFGKIVILLYYNSRLFVTQQSSKEQKKQELFTV